MIVTALPAMPGKAPVDRVYELADIRRAASFDDFRVEVSVAHTLHKLRARFCVTIHSSSSSSQAADNNSNKWAFGVDLKQVKHFETQLVHLVKNHKNAKCACRAHHGRCPLCMQLNQEIGDWKRFSPFSGIGKHHLDEKCERITRFFYRVFRLLSANAQWLQSCELLREILRATEALCHIQYPDDHDALDVIDSLKRVTPLNNTAPPYLTALNDGDQNDCSICLCSLNEPQEIPAASSSTLKMKPMCHPTQGVELRCGHRFHDTCICVWFHSHLNCPVCRQDAQAPQRVI